MTATGAAGWAVGHRRGPIDALLADSGPPAGRRVEVLTPERPAVVLGSTQSDGAIDRAAATRLGVDVARRRSGGGAVLVDPATSLWVDVVVPAGDPWWTPDVSRSFLWLGEVWRDALVGLGVTCTVFGGPVVRSTLASAVCFASRVPGEVVGPGPAGPKLVGLAQRRTRDHARYQCVVYERWDPSLLVEVLGPAVGDAPSPAGADAALADPVGLPGVGAGTGRPVDTVVAAFLTTLTARA